MSEKNSGINVFLYEHATCTGEIHGDIAVEGFAMFKTLFDGFTEIADVSSFISSDLAEKLNLPVSTDWFGNFKECVEEADYFLLIAPEDEELLFKLTRYAEWSSENLGCSSRAVKIASDKWLTYQKLKNKVNMPKTSLEPLDIPFIIKPRRSCGGEGISKGTDCKIDEGFIAQEFIDGVDLSVSLLVGEEIKVLSINRQILENFRYRGGEIPFKCENAEVVEEALNAVESIRGLNGYVGVDIVLADIPYVIEVNPRLTTTAIAFREVYGLNLADLILRNYEGREIPEFKPTKKVILKKIKGCTPDSLFHCRGYSIVFETEKN